MVGRILAQSVSRPITLTGTRPLFFTPARAIVVLPGQTQADGGTAYGISGDGKTKAGTVGVACYWDASNQFHALPHPDGAASNAFAISRDGSTIGGDVGEQDSSGAAVSIGTLWATGGTGKRESARCLTSTLAACWVFPLMGNMFVASRPNMPTMPKRWSARFEAFA